MQQTAGTDRAWWDGAAGATPARRFIGCNRTSVYVEARDGTRLAVDVYLPKDLPVGERLPTLLIPTPYFRSMEFRSPLFATVVGKLSVVGAAEFAREITAYGYANVVWELRGAGASFGRKDASLFRSTVADGCNILDWIAAQPWSNGRVGATGISGPGLLAQWLATGGHPALKAIAPRFTSFDMFGSTHPGGLTLGRFLVDIGKMLRAMDSNRLADMPESRVARLVLRLLVRGLQPVDGPDGRRLLAAAVREHAGNEHIDEQLIRVQHRDETLPGASETLTLDAISPFAHADAMRAAGVAVYAWAGWYDGAFARDMLALHNTVNGPASRIVIGPWGHGGRWYSSPLVAGRQATAFDHVAEMVRFFDLHLQARDHDVSREPRVHYFTMGEEQWKASAVWPPQGAQARTLYFAEGGALAEAAPAAPRADAEPDVLAVDFAQGTGVHSRFGKHLTGGRYPARYAVRRPGATGRLVWTGAALGADVEVTGHPVVRLFVESTAADAALLVYLEDVAPDGRTRCVTDGGLRASLRATSPAPYWSAGPFQACRQEDHRPLVPGQVTEVAFDLFPVSWLFRRGHRIRVSLGGADRDNVVPVAEDARPVLRVHRSPMLPSAIVLPVVPRAPA